MIAKDLRYLLSDLEHIRFATSARHLDDVSSQFVGSLVTLRRLWRITDDEFNLLYGLHENCSWYSYARTRNPNDWGRLCWPHWKAR